MFLFFLTLESKAQLGWARRVYLHFRSEHRYYSSQLRFTYALQTTNPNAPPKHTLQHTSQTHLQDLSFKNDMKKNSVQ